jgi:hypothetical protein
MSFFHRATARSRPRRSHYQGFVITLRHAHTHTHTHTQGRIPLDEGSARRGELYLTTTNTHKRQTSMPPAGFEPTIPATERQQINALDRAATGTGVLGCLMLKL